MASGTVYVGVWDCVRDPRDELINETLSGSGIAAEAVANAYDNDGNMTSQTRYSNLAETTVVAATSYTYDALDNRIGPDENGTQTWTLFDGSDPVMDFSGTGSLTMRYLNEPTGDIVDAVIARESAGGTIAWYLPDRLGTIRDLLSNTGTIIDHVDYSAFGTVLDESSPTNGDRNLQTPIIRGRCVHRMKVGSADKLNGARAH